MEEILHHINHVISGTDLFAYHIVDQDVAQRTAHMNKYIQQIVHIDFDLD